MQKQKILEDLKNAVIKRDEIEISTLRLLLDSILKKEKEKRYKIAQQEKNLKEEDLKEKSQLIDEEIIDVISFEIKKGEEAILEFEKGKRQDLVQKETQEIEVLKRYLPKQLEKQEIENIAIEIINKIGAKDLKDMGKVMKDLMPLVKGKAQVNEITKTVKELLTKKYD